MATSGALYCDNGNGRDNRATKVVYNGAEGKAILDWWKAGIDGGYFYNPGIDNAGATNAFNAGKTASKSKARRRYRAPPTTRSSPWVPASTRRRAVSRPPAAK